MSDITVKESDALEEHKKLKTLPKLDLHGFSLEEANRKVKKFIIESFNDGYKKILIVTGKGLRSKSYNNPYLSETLSMLKFSVPEYINNNEILFDKIIKVTDADMKDGGEGAIYVFLKRTSKFKE
jgi:DNA-nicking Smr family endonuclease